MINSRVMKFTMISFQANTLERHPIGDGPITLINFALILV